MRMLIASVALIGYAAVGYPLAIATLGRLRPRPIEARDEYTPSISLVVAALDEAAVIDAKLENVRALDYPADRVEVIVVADGSHDDTADRARRHPGTVVLHDPVRRGKAAALTRAAAIARGEILVFSDANNMLDRRAIRALVRPLADPSVGCATGRKMIQSDTGRPLDEAEGLYWRYESAIRRWESRAGSVTGVNGELLALRRDAFTPLPTDCVNDDFVLAMESAIAGWRIAYAEDAVSLEGASATTADEEVRRARIVAGRLHALAHVGPRLVRRDPMLAWQLTSHKVLRLVVPLPAAGALVGSVTLARRGGWARLPLVLHLLFLGAAAVGRGEERRNGRRRTLFVPYYACRMIAATTSGWLLALTRPPGRLATWQRVERASEVAVDSRDRRRAG